MTIGVAIAVPEPYASVLREARLRANDPLADSVPPHITLIGPTVVDRPLEELLTHVRAVADSHAQFVVRLRGTASFRPVSSVVFVQLSAGISECESLEAELRTDVLNTDTKFNYHPHVTVAHNVDERELDRVLHELEHFSAEFMVDTIYLYEHYGDGVWRPRCGFALRK